MPIGRPVIVAKRAKETPLLANVLEDLGRQRCSGLRAQTDEVLSAEGVHVEHAVIVQKAHSDWN